MLSYARMIQPAFANIDKLQASAFAPLRRSLSANWPLWLILAAYVLVYGIIMAGFPERSKPPVLTSIAGMGPLATALLVGYVSVRAVHLALTTRPKSPIRAILAEFKDTDRSLNGLHVLLVLFLFVDYFTAIKAAIPAIQPFQWDEWFYRADLLLHGGSLPHVWLQPFLGHPYITFAVNVVYNLWFFVMWGVLLFFAFQRKPSALRLRFLISFFLCWMISGSFFAILFSSAGPCFYGRLGFLPDPYADLMNYLRLANESVPIWAVNVQDMLWRGYETGQNFVGISAMPSLHNATSLLFALAAFQVSRGFGWAMTIFAAVIAVGSVILGWHYAVDAYVGWMITYAIWKAMGPISRTLTNANSD
jgi:hypothetical protein